MYFSHSQMNKSEEGAGGGVGGRHEGHLKMITCPLCYREKTRASFKRNSRLFFFAVEINSYVHNTATPGRETYGQIPTMEVQV